MNHFPSQRWMRLELNIITSSTLFMMPYERPSGTTPTSSRLMITTNTETPNWIAVKMRPIRSTLGSREVTWPIILIPLL
jgi:hypothetical protein